MIRLYDGNNIMRRAIEKHQMQGALPLTLRMRFEQQTPHDVWVWDGYDHNARRRDIYPAYKMNRPPIAEEIFAQVKLWKELLRHTPAAQIECYGWEADDVIGTLVRKRPGQFEVHTNDMDYGQVADMCSLIGVNMKGVPPRRIALYKALCGDKSDNIDGIPGFGPKRWLEMEKHWAEIESAIVRGEPSAFDDLPFKPAVKAWLTQQDNVDLLQQMLCVTHFQNVPDDELNGGTTRGTPNKMAGRARLSEFFL